MERLIAEHGDVKLTDLLVTLANCEKARSVSIYDRCRPAMSDTTGGEPHAGHTGGPWRPPDTRQGRKPAYGLR